MTILFNDNVEDWRCTSSSMLGSGSMGGNCSDSDTTSSSSIGKDSDVTGGDDYGNSTMGEVESPYKGGFDPIEASPEVLPLRRGVSTFYSGKSKSFLSLARASSIQDLAKPVNAYTSRRTKRSGACSSLRSNGGGISKKTFSKMGRKKMALAIALTAASFEACNINNITTGHSSKIAVNLVSPTFSPFQKPKHRVSGLSSLQHVMSKWRSFSLADLQYTSTGTSIGMPTTQCSRFGSTSSDKTKCPF